MKYNQSIQRLCLCVAYLAVVAANCSPATRQTPSTESEKTINTHGYNLGKDTYERIIDAGKALARKACARQSSDAAPQSVSSLYKDWYAFPVQWEASKRKEDAKWEAFWNQHPAVWETIYKKNDEEWIAFWEKTNQEFVSFWEKSEKEWKAFWVEDKRIYRALCRENQTMYATGQPITGQASPMGNYWKTRESAERIYSGLSNVCKEAINAYNEKSYQAALARVAFWKAYEEAWNKQQQAERERTQQKAYENKDTLRQERKAYAVLGLPMDAPLEEVKKAYRKLALTYHPDKQHEPKEQGTMKEREEFCNEKMKEINWARNTIEAYLVNNRAVA